jgi:CDP-diacylglycerol--glycerol-3-phosphate 3-phosphatidyltransferase
VELLWRPAGSPVVFRIPAHDNSNDMPSILPHSVPQSISRPVASAVARTGVTPNQVTACGFLVNAVAAVFVGFGLFVGGAILILIGSALDLVVGALARYTQRATPFGSVFDAVLDRYSEAVVLFGLLIWELNRGHAVEPALIFATVVGSLLVSYTRARSEVIGYLIKEGLFTRAERVVLLALALIFAGIPFVLLAALWVLAVLTNLTALQRLYFVWKRSKETVALAEQESGP